jgi:hypothetical protein
VHHVSVNEGGQAIVGNVTQRVRRSVPQKSSHKPPTNSQQEPMPIIEERQQERECVPARRQK